MRSLREARGRARRAADPGIRRGCCPRARVPEAFSAVREVPVAFGLRWVMLRSFPIKLVYTVRHEALLLVAVFHARRRPGYWLERLNQLGR